MMDPLCPQSRGARTLTATLDRWRETKPDKILASLLRSADISGGLYEWTMRDIANATDAWAHHLSDSLGRSTQFDTLGYIRINNLRYAAFVFNASNVDIR